MLVSTPWESAEGESTRIWLDAAETLSERLLQPFRGDLVGAEGRCPDGQQQDEEDKDLVLPKAADRLYECHLPMNAGSRRKLRGPAAARPAAQLGGDETGELRVLDAVAPFAAAARR